ncbi:F-box associated domain type 1 [Arabidopsis thaliana x Arabidopsis arenosa]|uniref:F-box associated domain type 1 n=1 Tax=Arabidopsis thaliana x Arabidopsis arenosa TaxID=1240361 RepID=A0A8T2C2R6_9BRAS|nr:F-box associated domain type 1 [Arabidopsis thaliana x Arabidopsis arenosa]
MNPLTALSFQLEVGAASFFIDEEKKAVVVFDKGKKDLVSTHNIAYIVGVNGILEEVDLGISGDKVCYPLVCSYVPIPLDTKFSDIEIKCDDMVICPEIKPSITKNLGQGSATIYNKSLDAILVDEAVDIRCESEIVPGPGGEEWMQRSEEKPQQVLCPQCRSTVQYVGKNIQETETRNNKLEMQSVNNKAPIEELDEVIESLCVPSEYAASLTGGSFDEVDMLQNIDACEWLAKALKGLEVPNLDPIYVNEKRAELEKLKATFVRRASEFLRNYFASLVDFIVSDKSYFSQRGQLKRPDHADLRYKWRTYARLLQHLKGLDKNCLGPLRKAYCSSLNLLLRREAQEFANELRASTKVSQNPTVWLKESTGSNQNANTDTSAVADAYAKMLTIFIPLLVDESFFLAHFMCFEVPALTPPGGAASDNKNQSNNDDLGIMDKKTGQNSLDLKALNESIQDLLDSIQEDFYAVIDWAYKIDPLLCISMHGITERQKADTAGFVRLLLEDLESRVSMQFSHMGVLPYIPRFAALATRMEQYIQGQSRDLVDQAYTKFVSIMFVTLEKIAQQDPKYADILVLENYAAFQNSFYELADVQFERLFQFAKKIEDFMYTITPEEIPLQRGLSKKELRKMLKSSLSGVDKSIASMYKQLQKNLTMVELLPPLWDKCKKEFLDKYKNFVELVAKVYPNENVPGVTEMRGLLASM